MTPADAGTVLVVDDSPENRYAVRRALVREGFTVLEAGTGADGLERAADDPDVVVLDVNLPDIDGFEVCRRLKAGPGTAHVPVLHLSQVRVDDAARVHGLDSGAEAYLTEPVDPTVLVATVRSLLRMRRAEDRLRRDLAHAEQLRDLAAVLSAADSVPEMAEAITRNAHRVLDARYVRLGVLDLDTEALDLHSGAGRRERVPPAAPIPETSVVRSGRPLVFAGREELAAAFPRAVADGSGGSGAACGADDRTTAVVPIPLPDGRIGGTLTAAWTAAGAVDGHISTLLADLAQRCGAVLLRGRLAARRARDLERSELTARVLGELEAVGSSTGRIRRLVDLVVPALADYAVVEQPAAVPRIRALAHRDPRLLAPLRTLRERHALEPGAAHSAGRAAAGEPHLIARITPERIAEYALDPDAAELMSRLGPRSHISVPLTGGDTVLMLGICDPDRPLFGPADLAYARELAARAGLGIATARLLEQEHATSARLQQALLPSTAPAHPAVRTALRYRPGDGSLEVGGDWHAGLLLPDGRLVVAVGDIVGHGLEAAAAMGQIRTGFSVLAPRCAGPAALLSELSTFTATVPAARYSSLACALLDPAGARLTYACAGHPPPVLAGPDGRARLLTGARSGLLGSGTAGERAEDQVDLPAGSTLFLYSDGLVERRGETIDTGLARLCATAERTAGLPVEAQCDAVLAGLTRDRPHDDVVLLAARLVPDAAGPVPAGSDRGARATGRAG